MDWLRAGITIAACERSAPLDSLETRMLMMHALGLSRVQLITQSETVLNADQASQLSTLIKRRLHGEPIAYLIGERAFFGLNFQVTSDVLIPRPDTELLVALAIERTPLNARILDLGTGSGAIAVSIAHARPDLHVTAVDINAAALEIAKANALRHLTRNRIQFLQSDWFQQIPLTKFHTIVSNPPYIVKDDRHLQEGDLRFEPINALTDHADGLSAYRTILEGARPRLHDGGQVLVEHGYDQAGRVRSLLCASGFNQIQSWTDLAGIERVSGGVLGE